MLVKDARKAARRWVLDEVSAIPGFSGAFFHGSTAWLPTNDPLPHTSDVDLILIFDEPGPPIKPGKLRYLDILLDVSILPSDQLRSPEQVLEQYYLAGSLRTATVILDKGGWLARLQTAVEQNFAKRQWVYRRCEHAMARVLRNLQSLHEAEQFPDQVTAWLFAVGVTTHILLVAGLRNPTVRHRYPAVQALLQDFGQSRMYDPLLDLVGCSRMSRAQAERHLIALTSAFDVAKEYSTTSFSFSSDISDEARSLAIEWSQDLIEGGLHREAIFWMTATYARCLTILRHDASEAIYEQMSVGFRRLLEDLGIISYEDLLRRGETVRASLPRIWDVAETIIAAHPNIVDD